MRTYTLAALVAAFLIVPAPAQADYADCSKKTEHEYTVAHRQAAKKFETGAGRNIRRDGLRFIFSRRARAVIAPPFCSDLRHATRQLKRLLVTPTYLRVRAVAPRQPPAGVKTRSFYPVGLADCIAFHESGYDPLASNGLHFGVAQWTIEAWLRHGGGRFAGHPHGATYQQQLVILNRGLERFGCIDWCPFDPC